MDVASFLKLTVSFAKTNFIMIESGIVEAKKLPLAVGDNTIEWVSEFPYLGSLVSDDGRIDAEVEKRIANASKAFGALRCAVFDDTCQLPQRDR